MCSESVWDEYPAHLGRAAPSGQRRGAGRSKHSVSDRQGPKTQAQHTSPDPFLLMHSLRRLHSRPSAASEFSGGNSHVSQSGGYQHGGSGPTQGAPDLTRSGGGWKIEGKSFPKLFLNLRHLGPFSWEIYNSWTLQGAKEWGSGVCVCTWEIQPLFSEAEIDEESPH